MTWSQLFTGLTAAIATVLLQKLFEYIQRKRAETKMVEENLDPILKSGDELLGKIYSLAKDDFKSIVFPSDRNGGYKIEELKENHDVVNFLYLFAKFWANIEILRYRTNSFFLNTRPVGKEFQVFQNCLESKAVRVTKRNFQRALGELMLERNQKDISMIFFREFSEIIFCETDVDMPLQDILKTISRLNNTKERQKILVYATVLHAMLDTIDPSHYVAKDRPTIQRKLTKKSRKDLRYRIFGVHLKIVSNWRKYIDLP